MGLCNSYQLLVNLGLHIRTFLGIKFFAVIVNLFDPRKFYSMRICRGNFICAIAHGVVQLCTLDVPGRNPTNTPLAIQVTLSLMSTLEIMASPADYGTPNRGSCTKLTLKFIFGSAG